MRKLISLALICSASMALSGALSAQVVKPIPWKEPGLAPFEGSHKESCELHMKHHALFKSMEYCLMLHEMSDDANVCPKRPILQDGVELWMPSTVKTSGRPVHKMNLQVVDFGKDVPADDERRMVNDCTQLAGAAPVVKPLECSNYSVIVTKKVTEVKPPLRWVCRDDNYSNPVNDTFTQYLQGVILQNCCCETLVVPALLIDSTTTLQSKAQSQTCGWEPLN